MVPLVWLVTVPPEDMTIASLVHPTTLPEFVIWPAPPAMLMAMFSPVIEPVLVMTPPFLRAIASY